VRWTRGGCRVCVGVGHLVRAGGVLGVLRAVMRWDCGLRHGNWDCSLGGDWGLGDCFPFSLALRVVCANF
jgi:hypothetical protein